MLQVQYIDEIDVFKFSEFTTDGEWNSLCSQGNTRPTSIFQIHAVARSIFFLVLKLTR